MTLNNYSLQQFTVSAGSVDVIGNGSFLNYPGNGTNQYIDMCGSTGACGTLTSKGTFCCRYLYGLHFTGRIIYPANNGYGAQNDGVAVTLGNTTFDYTVGAQQPAETFTDVFTVGPAGAQLVISDLGLSGNQNIGASLLGANVSPVPVPGALPLFGSALVGVGVLARRRVRKPPDI